MATASVSVLAETLKPTEVHDRLVPWIYAENPSSKDIPDDGIDEEAKEEIAMKMFQELLDSGKSITADDFKAIAKQVNDMSGKWLVYRDPENINDTWEKIVKATQENKLGPGCKVSTAGQARHQVSEMHVICVYTDDYTDEKDVNRVEAGLREIGIGGIISYKPDIYTSLGIYENNPWKIKPTVYTSTE